jgi:GH15 family glucan-1,4-alpha-glucosidase
MSRPWIGIEDHGAIGNLRTVGLVARDGSIDWLCLPDLDSPSVFGALLDPDRGGSWRISPPNPNGLGEQRYVEHTNVLETRFDGPRGRLVVTDFLPLRGSLDDPGRTSTVPAVYRILRAEGGDTEAQIEWSPRFRYGEAVTQMARTEHGWLAWAGQDAMTLSDVGDRVTVEDHPLGPVLRAHITLRGGERRAVLTHWGSQPSGVRLDDAQQQLHLTSDAWRGWVHKAEATGPREWAQPHSDLIVRSELALKLLTHANTGAVAAAATTSLPEEVGGVRNWDYRYSWIRDGGLVAQALFALGHRTEAEAFVAWAERVARTEGKHSWGLQVVYGLHGQHELAERELPGLAGYRDSAPVRIGNGAVDQLQLDIYGELISAAYEVIRLGGELSEDILRFLPAVADQACAAWQQPDYGLWELRNGPFSFVYSKCMVWMGLDRAGRLADHGLIEGDLARWRAAAADIADDVLANGYDPTLGAFKQSYERPVLDASNVLLPLMEFLPIDDPRVQRTIDATIEGLTEQGLVYRYHAEDGLAGGEGAFVLCTFWLADALALSGRVDEAEQLYENMVGHSNHVGLYGEQIDPSTGAFLGNFPQVFSHIGLLNTSLYLAAAQGREIPVPSLIGSDAHRAQG